MYKLFNWTWSQCMMSPRREMFVSEKEMYDLSYYCDIAGVFEKNRP